MVRTCKVLDVLTLKKNAKHSKHSTSGRWIIPEIWQVPCDAARLAASSAMIKVVALAFKTTVMKVKYNRTTSVVDPYAPNIVRVSSCASWAVRLQRWINRRATVDVWRHSDPPVNAVNITRLNVREIQKLLT